MKVNENYNLLKKQELQRRIAQLEELIADCNQQSSPFHDSQTGVDHHEVQQSLSHEYYNNSNYQQHLDNNMKAKTSLIRSSSKCSSKALSTTSRQIELLSVVGSNGNLPPFSWFVYHLYS